MNNLKLLKYCLNEIERKLGWKKSVLWKDPDFLRLSKLIVEKTQIAISPHTLKRLFGKIKYKDSYNPQAATKDALSIFLGFANWDEFVKASDPKTKIEVETAPSFDSKKGILKKGLILIFVFLLIFVSFLFFSEEYTLEIEKETTPFKLILKDSIGVVPYTINLNYEAEQLPSDSTFIDFNFKQPIKGFLNVKVAKKRFEYNFTYQIPGYFPVDLKSNGDILSTKKVLALSKGWDSYFTYEGNDSRFWLDNKIKPTDTNSYLYYSPEYLKDQGFDIKPVYRITHRLFKEFEIDGDNFELNTRFKSSEALGGITCYDFIVNIICANDYFKNNNINVNINKPHIRLMEFGCSMYSGLAIGETSLDGKTDDLTTFVFKPGEWNTLSILIKKKNVEIIVNDDVIYTGTYDKPNGKIVGIENTFKGTGMLDYIKIKDLNTDQVFIDDF